MRAYQTAYIQKLLCLGHTSCDVADASKLLSTQARGHHQGTKDYAYPNVHALAASAHNPTVPVALYVCRSPAVHIYMCTIQPHPAVPRPSGGLQEQTAHQLDQLKQKAEGGPPVPPLPALPLLLAPAPAQLRRQAYCEPVGGGGSTVASSTTGMSPAPLLTLQLTLLLLMLLHLAAWLHTGAWLLKHTTG
jgi:hypothetical protein